jgi:hypothetical protein
MHCAQLANPALGDFLAPDALKLSRGTRENTYRRQRLCQFVEDNEAPFLTPDVWDSLGTGVEISAGSKVVIGLDGSFGGAHADCTALVIGTVSANPHFDLLAIFESDGSPDYRVDVLAVENAIRQARRKWDCVELVYDPFRYTRTGQIMASEGLATSEFPWSPSRVTRAVTDLWTAATNGNFTHSSNETLRRHALAAMLVEKNNGLSISKTSRRANAPKVDALAALVMTHSRCVYLGTRKQTRRRVIGSR